MFICRKTQQRKIPMVMHAFCVLELKKRTVCPSVRDGGETPVGIEANWQTQAYRPDLFSPPQQSGAERRGEERSGVEWSGSNRSGEKRNREDLRGVERIGAERRGSRGTERREK